MPIISGYNILPSLITFVKKPESSYKKGEL